MARASQVSPVLMISSAVQLRLVTLHPHEAKDEKRDDNRHRHEKEHRRTGKMWLLRAEGIAMDKKGEAPGGATGAALGGGHDQPEGPRGADELKHQRHGHDRP